MYEEKMIGTSIIAVCVSKHIMAEFFMNLFSAHYRPVASQFFKRNYLVTTKLSPPTWFD